MVGSVPRAEAKGRVAFVLGHRGMLGAVVHRYLRERGYAVLTSERRYGGQSIDELVQEVVDSPAGAIVNCLGVIPASGVAGREMMMANALFPVHLSSVLEGRLLIHASTDCVFDGRRGWCRADEPPNAKDAYGLSKLVGEACVAAPNVVVLRTSIVGPAAGAGRGLLGWFLRQESPVDGWTDHLWNGITTLAWAELAARTVEGSGLGPGIHQPTTAQEVTKDELLRLFGEVFEHRVDIRPVRTELACDRTLLPTTAMPPLRQQLIALRAWMNS
jgi:dTDP-4-dehydrorhamnose reductase